MINGDDPTPLDDPASQSPESLVRALRALGRQQPSAAALRAAGQRLQSRLTAPPSAAPAPVAPAPLQSASVQTGGTSALLTGRLMMIALTAAVGVGSLVLVQRTAPESAPPRVTSAELPGSPVAPETTPVAVPSQQLAAPPASKAAATTSAAPTHQVASPATRPAQAHVPAAKTSAPRRVRAPAADKTDGHADAPSLNSQATVVSTDPTTDKSTAAPAHKAEAADNAQQPSTSSRDPEPSPATARPGELALLLQAQTQSHKDPRAALRLTAEHARRFPRGVLAPEREVLAIEALRALGLTEQADARLRDFRAAYPDSLHTRALTTGTTR